MNKRNSNIIHHKRFNSLDYLIRDLWTQFRRLSFGHTVWRGSTYCPYPPRKIAIEPSSFCNLNCIHCAHGIGSDGKERFRRKKSLLDFDLYKKITDEASQFKYSTRFVFALMGEPLMNKKFVDMIAYAHKKGIWTQLNTNAVLLDPHTAESLIDAGLDMIYFSLDGITKETYEKIRQRSNFSKVYENVINFIELKFKKNAKNLIIHVGMTGEAENSHELDIFFREMRKLPVNGVYSPLLFNWNGEIEWANSELEKLNSLNTDQRPPVCNPTFDMCGIQANGNFTACIYDHEGKHISGNVKDNTILELWNNKRTRQLRKAVLDGKYSVVEKNGLLCSMCTLKYNPVYQIDNRLLGNLKNTAQWSSKALIEFFDTPLRHRRLDKKAAWLMANKEVFLNDLNANHHTQKKNRYDEVRDRGVILIKN